MNEDGGRSMSQDSLFCQCNVLLINCVGTAFSSETVKYLMNVFVRVLTFHITSSL